MQRNKINKCFCLSEANKKHNPEIKCKVHGYFYSIYVVFLFYLILFNLLYPNNKLPSHSFLCLRLKFAIFCEIFGIYFWAKKIPSLRQIAIILFKIICLKRTICYITLFFTITKLCVNLNLNPIQKLFIFYFNNHYWAMASF